MMHGLSEFEMNIAVLWFHFYFWKTKIRYIGDEKYLFRIFIFFLYFSVFLEVLKLESDMAVVYGK